jgi:NTP pyrophosphatase (non-canonical NTP hydrolase)
LPILLPDSRVPARPLGGRAESAAPAIFQFWHDPNPPAYIQEFMDSWIANCPEFVHRLFDDATASELIRQNFGERHLNAYLSCRLPAMRSDLFRLCVLYLYGGVYVDADQSCRASIYSLYQSCGRGCLFVRLFLPLAMIFIPNGFMIVKRAMDPLLGKALDVAVENIEKRISNNVYEITGPGIITDFWENGDGTLFEQFNFLSDKHVCRLISFHGSLPYQQNGRHWIQVQMTERIFTDTGIATVAAQTGASKGDAPAEQRAGGGGSVFDGINLILPALARAAEVSRCAARVGLDWPYARAPAKIVEGAAKLAAELDSGADQATSEELIGDLLYAVSNLARKLEIEPEGALRRTTAAFERRFRRVETLAAERGIGQDLAALEALWLEAKREES